MKSEPWLRQDDERDFSRRPSLEDEAEGEVTLIPLWRDADYSVARKAIEMEPPLRSELVDRLRAEVWSGTYSVTAAQVARRLVPSPGGEAPLFLLECVEDE